MKSIENENRMEFDKSGLRDLLTAFLRDPFVQSQNLRDLNLEEIGTFFEGQDEAPHTDIAGFERAKSHYCLILLELELLGFTDSPVEPLSVFYASMGGEREKEVELPSELPDLSFPPTEIVLDQFVLPGGSALESSISKDTSWKTLLNSIQSPSGRAYFELSRTLTLAGSFPRSIRSEDLDRLNAQCQIWSIECELFERTKPALMHFWPHRDTHISRILCQNGRAYDFHPGLKEGLENFAKNHPDWLYENKFPISGILSSLRYLMSVPAIEKFVPAAIDFAALILLFGRNSEYGAQLIYNVLGISGISGEEILELSARLSRLQRLKAKILNPHQPLTTSISETVRSDAAAALPLVLRIEIQLKGSSVKEVA